MKPRIYLAAALIAGGTLLAVLARPQALQPRPEAARLRTVLVIEPGRPAVSPLVRSRQCGGTAACRNGEAGIDVTALLAGAPPASLTTATVLTDTDCMPDRVGISHCVNTLRLAGGATLTVRHDHDMRLYPCLTAGETVRVVPMTGV